MPLPGWGLGWGNQDQSQGGWHIPGLRAFTGESGAVQIFLCKWLGPPNPATVALGSPECSVALCGPDGPSPTPPTHACTHTRAHAHTCARTSCRRTEGAVTVGGSPFPGCRCLTLLPLSPGLASICFPNFRNTQEHLGATACFYFSKPSRESEKEMVDRHRQGCTVNCLGPGGTHNEGT